MMESDKKNLTVFGRETEFDGVLEFSDNLIITGKFSGTIHAKGNLEIAKDAVCMVDIMSAQSIIVSGSVTGNIEASEHLEMCNGSTVKGDVKTARLRIAENVDFEGSVTMLDQEPQEDLFSLASAEFKKALIVKSDVAR
ncbi:MAG: polymer-forming cytoskeletal protein [Treponema sp.]|nr:polymer-forming cytoskeletal protein [Treponema sp.]